MSDSRPLPVANDGDAVPMPLHALRDLCRIAMYAALIGAGAFIHVPVGPMHISLQTMLVMLAGFILGPKKAALAILVYLAAGFIGLPMFGRGKAGPAAFLGPTSGFFLGFLLGAVIAGFSARFGGGKGKRIAVRLAFGAAGSVILLLTGTLVLRLRFFDSWRQALMVGFFPFLPGDLVKMAIAAFLPEAFSMKTEEADGD